MAFAAVVAATRTAHAGRVAVVDEMRRVFAFPVRYTLGAFEVRPATRADPVALVRPKLGGGGKNRPAWRYLVTQVVGGPRAQTPMEVRLSRALGVKVYAVPDLASRGARWTLSGGQVTKMLSDLQALGDVAGSNGNANPASTRAGRRKRKTKAGGIDRRPRVGQYFLHRGADGAPRAIFRLVASDLVVRAWSLTTRAPRYRPRLAYDRVLADTVREVYPRELAAAAERYAFRRAAAA